MTQQLILDPLGIVTEPNPLGQIPAGALSLALNCCIRRPGIIENMRGWTTLFTVPSDAGTTACFLIATPGPYSLVIFNKTAGWFYCWFDQTSGASLFGGAAALSFTLSTLQPQSIATATQPGFSACIIGQQIFLNTYSTVLVWDTYTPTSAATAAPRLAGVQQAQLYNAAAVFSSPGLALKPDTYAFWIAIVRRTVGDKVALSAPCGAIYGDNDGGADVNVDLTLKLTEQHYAGDVIEIYRTKGKPSGITGAQAEFQRGEEAGAEYLKVTGYTLTSADITAGQVVIRDSCDDDRLGEALYTNQSVSSVGAAAYPPPALDMMTVYKGHLFGFGSTRPPSFTMRPKGPWQFVTGTLINQFPNMIGQINLSGCTWSAGGPPTVVTVSPTSQLAALRVGVSASRGGAFSGTITAIGASTFTVNSAASSSGSSLIVSINDQAVIDGNFLFINDWRATFGILGVSKRLALIAPALKLPKYTPTAFQAVPTDGFTMMRRYLDDARNVFTIAASAENNWDPIVASYLAGTPTSATIERKPSAMVWSEGTQPEAWPFTNVDYFSQGTPCAAIGTRDCILVFCTDGIWRVSGTGGSAGEGYDWRADLVATNITVQGSQTVCALHDVVYALTSDGLIAIDAGSSGRKISQGRIHDTLSTPPWTDGPYTTSTACFLVADEEHNEILIREPSLNLGYMWLYNVNTDRFTQISTHEEPFHGDYSRTRRQPMIVGRDGGTTWTVKTQSGNYQPATMRFQPVYADNPFAQRQWQTFELSTGDQNSATSTLSVRFNLTNAQTVTKTATTAPSTQENRMGVDVPRNAPAIGNTMLVTVDIISPRTNAATQLYGFALNYKDQTDRRKVR